MGKDSLCNLKIFLGLKNTERKRNPIPWTVRFKLEVPVGVCQSARIKGF